LNVVFYVECGIQLIWILMNSYLKGRLLRKHNTLGFELKCDVQLTGKQVVLTKLQK